MKLAAQSFESIRQLNGISQQAMTEHYKLYEGYVNKYNEIQAKLAQADKSVANQVSSDWRSLKLDLTFAIGGVKNHELYFAGLGGQGGEPAGVLAEQIVKDFGSIQTWQDDLQATAMAARGWAWLAWDRQWQRLENVLGDTQSTFPVWNAIPIIALDVYEHAYYLDFQTKRADYVRAYLANLNWGKIEQLFEAEVK